MTAGNGILSIKLIKYSNSEGKIINGSLCDPVSLKCDQFFNLCVNDLVHYDACKLGEVSTGITRQSNTIVFGNKIGLISNPMVFNFNGWLVSKGESFSPLKK